MILKRPKRDPDYKTKSGWCFWFEEMIQQHVGNERDPGLLFLKDNKFYWEKFDPWFYFDSYNDDLLKAYNEWLNKKILE